MPVQSPPARGRWFLLALMSLLAVFALSASSAMANGGGAVYTQTNDPNGNTVQRFDRAPNGTLEPAGSFATGGVGLASLVPRRPFTGGAARVSLCGGRPPYTHITPVRRDSPKPTPDRLP